MAKHEEIEANIEANVERVTRLNSVSKSREVYQALSEFGRHHPACAAAASGKNLDRACDCGWNYWRTLLLGMGLH